MRVKNATKPTLASATALSQATSCLAHFILIPLTRKVPGDLARVKEFEPNAVLLGYLAETLGLGYQKYDQYTDPDTGVITHHFVVERSSRNAAYDARLTTLAGGDVCLILRCGPFNRVDTLFIKICFGDSATRDGGIVAQVDMAVFVDITLAKKPGWRSAMLAGLRYWLNDASGVIVRPLTLDQKIFLGL